MPDAVPDKVYAVIRGDLQSASGRLEKALSRALNAANHTEVTPAQLMSRIQILEGDICQSMFGLSEEDLRKLRSVGIDEVWGIASSLSPNDWKKNVASARELARLAVYLDANSVHYLSTAYVTGRYTAEIPIDGDLGVISDFNNDYERGKYLSEQNLVETLGGTDVKLSLLRPTIIVGSRDTKLPAGSNSGIYGAIQILKREADRKARKGDDTPLTIAFGDGSLNLVGIDQVVDEMLSARERQKSAEGCKPDCRFIPGSNVPVKRLFAVLSERIGIALAEPGAQQSHEMQRLNDKLSFFLPYTLPENRKRFSSAEKAEADKIYEIDLINLIEASYNEISNRPLMDRLRIYRIARPDSSPLIAYASRDFIPERETIVIANAYGMPVNVLHPLIAYLSDLNMNVITWGCRGLPDQGFDVTQPELKISDQYSDWEILRSAFNLEKCVLLGWSTGAVLASYIASRDPQRVSRLCLLNGSFMHPGAVLTDFQKNLKSIMPKVAISRSLAGSIYKTVFKQDRSRFIQILGKDVTRRAEAAMNVTDPSHKHLVQLLTAGPEEVFRYARLIRSFIKEDPMEWLDSIQLQTLILTGENDNTAHPQGSRDASAAIPGASLIVDPEGDHFSIYSSPSFIATIANFCLSPFPVQEQSHI
tara:strand:- start:6696 stop:8636 length:1941 start_codon:yes stop_codon:yes gene_type:complete